MNFSVIDMCSTKTCLALPLILWVLINSVLTLIGSALVTFVEPQAAGSGIPQIKSYLNGIKIPGLLSLRALVAKAVGVVLSVLGGLACGKEGPMIHSGSIVAAGMSQGRARACRCDFKILKNQRTDHERRDFVSAGAAAGVSAAFGAPIGGVLFSLEEGASFWNQTLTWKMVFASMIATFTVNLVLSAVHGHPEDLSNPGLISFGKFPDISYHIIEVPVFLLMGVFGGITGALFVHINYKLTLFRKRYLCAKWLKVIEAVIVAAISAVVAFLMLYFMSDCKSATNHSEKEEHTLQIYCPDGEYSAMASIFFKTPEASLSHMLHQPLDEYSASTLAVFSVMYFMLTCWTYGLSVSSGVFIPSLLSGAAWGRLVGIGMSYLTQEAVHNIGKYALIGAACQLGGTVRMTISLTVILVECTGDITFGLPIMMVLILAKWVGDFFNTGLYDLHIQLMGLPFLPCDPPPLTIHIPAKQIMSKQVVTVRVTEKVGRIVTILEQYPHSGFPVVDDRHLVSGGYGKLKGLILRSQLLLLLRAKCFEIDKSTKVKLSLSDFQDVYPRVTPIEDLFSDEEKNFTVDLEPYMNPFPYAVRENVSLPKMYTLFRGLGLRHVIVINDTYRVQGILTRKDLAKFRARNKNLQLRIQELKVVHH